MLNKSKNGKRMKEAVESGTIYSPYSGELGEDADEC